MSKQTGESERVVIGIYDMVGFKTVDRLKDPYAMPDQLWFGIPNEIVGRKIRLVAEVLDE